jgi:quinoprotein glucose dehydrogenase
MSNEFKTQRSTAICLMHNLGLTFVLAVTMLLFSGWSPKKPFFQSESKSKPAQLYSESALDWPAYGHDPGGSRYSPLTAINRDNVKDLKVAWMYRTGDVADGSQTAETSQFEATPIMVDGTLYLSTPFNRTIALDPETGARLWSYDPKIDLSVPYSEGLRNCLKRSSRCFSAML